MKERLLLLYELNKIDKELQELKEQKGDLPALIESQNEQRERLESEFSKLKDEISELESLEKDIVKEIETISKRIDKDDNILRSGGVKSNEEYNALAKEIDDGYEKIDINEEKILQEITPRKKELNESLELVQQDLNTVLNDLTQNKEELEILNKASEDEENELLQKRKELIGKIPPEDLEFYERINSVLPGEAVSIVRKGSCLGCYNSIPPQRVIEIRMSEKFYKCESCGRILVSEEFIIN